MDSSLFESIFKRRSFHLFRDVGPSSICQEDEEAIMAAYASFKPLDPTIKTAIKIVEPNETSYHQGAERTILFYSEKKGNYLQNIGYLGEQLDLYLVKEHYGTLWLGLGKTKEKSYEGLDFVIMMSIHRVWNDQQFRADMFQSKRKKESEIWQGKPLERIGNIARFAPSAMNSQPWLVKREENTLKVYRKKLLMNRLSSALIYFNCIDMGIFLCFLDLCLEKEGYAFSVQYEVDDCKKENEILLATYTLT